MRKVLIIIFCCTVAIGCCNYYLSRYYNEDTYYSELASDVISSEDQSSTNSNITVDTQLLSSVNSDYIGWIHFSGLFDYPIVQGNNNEYYLSHSFLKESSSHGCPFLDVNCNSDFTSRANWIFAHNMRDRSMFSKLKDFSDYSFFKEHSSFQIIIKGKTINCEIFSCYKTDLFSDDIQYDFLSDSDFYAYASSLKSMSLYDTGVSVNKDDIIVSLVTCTSVSENERMVVHAVIS